MSDRKRLGRGLEALIGISSDNEEGVLEVKINNIEPNRDQPRKKFDEGKLKELAESIKKHGIVQPIIVKKEDGIYRIIAGERRWRAAKYAGIDTIPVLVKDLNDREIIEVGLIENLQREDLNPIEEAEAFEILIKEHKLTQEEISEIVGRSRPAIANSLRLLSLKEEVREGLIKGEITGGHGRALLMLEDKEKQVATMNEIISKQHSVRETERLIKAMNDKTKRKKESKSEVEKDIEIKNLEEILRNILGTKVLLNHGKKSGKIIIEYYSKEELEGIIEKIKKAI